MVEETPLRVREVAAQLGVKEGTVRTWLHAGKMRGTKVGGRIGYLVQPAEVRRFMQDGFKAPTAEAANNGG